MYATRSLRRRGFTLTEAAIVLGIVGLILGAVWVAANSVYNNMRLRTANEQLLTIAQNVRNLMSVSPTFGSPTGTNITGAMLNKGVFPSSALRQFVGANNAITFNTVNPWDPIAVAGALNGAGTNGQIRINVSPNAADRFVITYVFVNNASTQPGRTKDCNAFLVANLRSGPVQVFNNNAWADPTTVSAETVTCGTYNGLYGAHFEYSIQ
jgi:type II secretory pathway pseudopilin PulG